MDSHLKKGQQAEQLACEYLEKEGLHLVQKNYRCPMGEIDLIMKDNGMLVFVEVRYRKNTKYGSGAETVTGRKQQKLLSTAMHYLQRHAKSTQTCRFDVVSMTNETNTDKIQWLQDAFQA
ncbi:MAG: YraN family protein [Gammaproteobacteria bacterium]|nr:YraN family protein [Gammaproteobacteria bacterium]